MIDRNEQTICAISTPHGHGGISVIRVSGPRAADICKKIAPGISNKSLSSHKAYFSSLYDSYNSKIDEVVLTYFEKGRSFTGEEVVEISCHGSPFICQQILDLLVDGGARLAERGEFTFRAFMNDRMDLVQAESVLSLIESQSKMASKVALRQLEGAVSKQYEQAISELTWCLAHIEASIDFIEQGVEVVNQDDLLLKLERINLKLLEMINSYRGGRLVKEGVRLALVGEPNVGKSSLLNNLLGKDRAIVTPIAGTTRDVIEDAVLFDGVKFNLVDTAGLRETEDQVELLGIDRSKQEAVKADVVAIVADGTKFSNVLDSLKLYEQLSGHSQEGGFTNSKCVLLVNKSDLISDLEKEEIEKALIGKVSFVFTNAISNSERKPIFDLILHELGSLEFLSESTISSSRQFEQTQYSHEMISKSIVELRSQVGAEFVAMYLKEALISLQKILGQVYDDQIMDRVFKEFCLGK